MLNRNKQIGLDFRSEARTGSCSLSLHQSYVITYDSSTVGAREGNLRQLHGFERNLIDQKTRIWINRDTLIVY